MAQVTRRQIIGAAVGAIGCCSGVQAVARTPQRDESTLFLAEEKFAVIVHRRDEDLMLLTNRGSFDLELQFSALFGGDVVTLRKGCSMIAYSNIVHVKRVARFRDDEPKTPGLLELRSISKGLNDHEAMCMLSRQPTEKSRNDKSAPTIEQVIAYSATNELHIEFFVDPRSDKSTLVELGGQTRSAKGWMFAQGRRISISVHGASDFVLGWITRAATA